MAVFGSLCFLLKAKEYCEKVLIEFPDIGLAKAVLNMFNSN